MNFIISTFLFVLLDYLLYLIFDLLKLKNIALYFLALSGAPLFGLNSKKIANYCINNCKDKNCKNCRLWNCEYYAKNLEKEQENE